MEVKVTVKRRWVKDGPIEMNICSEDYNANAIAILDNERYGAIGFDIAIRAADAEYTIAMLDVIKNEYKKLLQERKDK